MKWNLLIIFGIIVLVFLGTTAEVTAYTWDGSGNCDCSSTCADCTSALNDNTNCANSVNLTSNIAVAGANCIDDPPNSDNKVLDCKGYYIDGDDTAGTYGIYLEKENGLTIRNCNITNFERGIYLDDSDGATVEHNNITSGVYGIYFDAKADTNTVNWNELCDNSNTDIYNLDSNTGDNNTCDTTYNWNDIGGVGCSYDCNGLASFSECTSCADCIDKLNVSVPNVVCLTQDITDHVGTCITFPELGNNKVFECLEHTIDGDGVAEADYGIFMANKHNITIEDCIITEFGYGIRAQTVWDVNFTNNIVNSNVYRGIWMDGVAHDVRIENSTVGLNGRDGLYLESPTYNIIVNNNTFCNNNQSGGGYYDIYDLDENSGDNNTCDTYSNWNDTGTIGCTWICSGQACGDTITSDTTLSGDLVCIADGLTIGASNTLLDCDGNSIKRLNPANPTHHDETRTGLVSYWYLDESSGTNASDSINENHGTVYGASWNPGKVNNALEFDGVDDYVNVPDNDDSLDMPGNSMTLSLWAKLIDDSTDDIICAKADNTADPDREGYLLDIQSDRLRFRNYYVGGGDSGYQLSLDVVYGSWQHFVAVRDGDNAYIYINGVLGNNASGWTNTIQASTSALRLGWADTQTFNGTIDEVAIYNRALTAEEIYEDYHRSKGGHKGVNITLADATGITVKNCVIDNFEYGIYADPPASSVITPTLGAGSRVNNSEDSEVLYVLLFVIIIISFTLCVREFRKGKNAPSIIIIGIGMLILGLSGIGSADGACNSTCCTACSTAYSMSSGETRTAMCGADEQFFNVTTTLTCNITWTMDPTPNTDYDLYTLNSGSCPTTSSWDCRPFAGPEQPEICTQLSVPAGTYNAMVDYASGTGNYSMNVVVSGCAGPCTYECNSCDDCETKITAASDGDTVCLTQNIGPYTSICIYDPDGFNNIIFDCQGFEIDLGAGVSDDHGFWIIGKENGTIKNCIIHGNSTDAQGIAIRHSQNWTLINNTVYDLRYGIGLYNSSLCNISDNNASGNEDTGIELWYSNNNTIYNNTCNNNSVDGIYISLAGSENNTITFNNVSNNNKWSARYHPTENFADGLVLYVSTKFNIVENNTIEDNTGRGVHFASASDVNNTLNNNTICGNNIIGGYYDIENDGANNSGDDNTCDTTSNWNDTGTTGCTNPCAVPPVGKTNLLLKNNTLTSCTYGIYALNINDSIIDNCTVSNNQYPIYLNYTPNMTINITDISPLFVGYADATQGAFNITFIVTEGYQLGFKGCRIVYEDLSIAKYICRADIAGETVIQSFATWGIPRGTVIAIITSIAALAAYRARRRIRRWMRRW